MRPFAEWYVVRDARSRAARARHTNGAASGDIKGIQAVIRLLNWLDEDDRELVSLKHQLGWR